jgi:hypothetical protein
LSSYVANSDDYATPIAYAAGPNGWYRTSGGNFVDAEDVPVKYVAGKWRSWCGEVSGLDIYHADGSGYVAYDEVYGWKAISDDGIWIVESSPSPGATAEEADSGTPKAVMVTELQPIVFSQVDPGDRARAVALGPDFQLNIGRTRAVGTYVDENERVWPQETDESIAVGGFRAGGAGTLNLIGAIARALNETSTAGSRLRIDSGWTVNCFSPVRDVESTEILHGRMVLMAKDSPENDALQAALDQLASTACVSTGEIIEGKPVTKYYGGDANAPDYAGGIQLLAGDYPILGRLTVASSTGQRLIFGTAMGENAHGEWVHHTAGQLILNGSGSNTFGPQLQLWDGGAVFGLKLAGKGDGFAGPINSLVIAMPNATDEAAMQALFSVADETPTRGEQLVNGQGQVTPYYFVEAAIGGLLSQSLLLDMASGCGYTADAADGLRLLWLDGDGPQRGLVIASVEGDRILKEELDPLLPPPLRFSPGDDSLGGKHFYLFSGELVQMLLATNGLQFGHLRDHCGDVRGSDPFVTVLYSHLERRGNDDTPGFGCNLRGLSLGEDLVRPIGANSLLRLGACLAHVNGTLRTFDLPEPLVKTAKQRVTSATAFAALEQVRGKIKANSLASITAGQSSGKLRRTDGEEDCYRGKTSVQFLAIRGEGTRNIFSSNRLQLGLWCGAGHTVLHQSRYTEQGVGTELVSAPSATGQFLNTLLGINLEMEGGTGPTQRLRLCGKVGWDCQAVRHFHRGFATIADTGLEPFRPRFSLGDKNLCHASASFRKRSGEHWNFSGTWQGNFGRHTTQNDLSLTVGYVF